MTTAPAWADTALSTTMPQLFSRNATEYGDHPALTDAPGDHERTWTWAEAFAETRELAAGLADLGLRPGQTMLIMMGNRAEHWLADAAASHLGAVPSTVYATFSPEQCQFVARHSRARVAVLEGPEQVRRFGDALRGADYLDHVVVLDDTARAMGDDRFLTWDALRRRGERRLADDPELVTRYSRAVRPEDPVTVLYTSGTTGDPKGVVLTHRNVGYSAAMLREITGTPMHSRTVCYLPLAHIAERMTGIYAPIHDAAHVHFCPDPAQVVARLTEVRPRSFFAVPRVWEKVAAMLQAVPEEQRSTPEMRRQLRERIGLDRTTWPASGAAPISVGTLEFFASLGIGIVEVWGMTETTGCATTNTVDEPRMGTVGRAVPGVEVRTGEDGEVLVRGPIVCAGYLQADGAVVAATDADGWLHTGDVGTLDEDGCLTITDRKKELIISSQGKNIAPTAVENGLKAHPLVGHALAYGDRRPYVVALVALDEDAAPAWARARGIEDTSITGLAENPEVLSEVERAVQAANARLNRSEQVKHHRVVPGSWTPESGELTPTLKLRRRVIHDRYADTLDSLYT